MHVTHRNMAYVTAFQKGKSRNDSIILILRPHLSSISTSTEYRFTTSLIAETLLPLATGKRARSDWSRVSSTDSSYYQPTVILSICRQHASAPEQWIKYRSNGSGEAGIRCSFSAAMHCSSFYDDREQRYNKWRDSNSSLFPVGSLG